jgi:hypothetical protein
MQIYSFIPIVDELVLIPNEPGIFWEYIYLLEKGVGFRKRVAIEDKLKEANNM